MTWFKVDDGLPASRKVLSIPRSVRLSAIGLWTLAGAWSAGEELDGHVPDYMVTELGGTPRLVEALIKSGLWVEVADGAQFSKWAEYQPTRAELEAARQKEAERKRRWRERQHPASVPAGQDGGREAESGHPDPTRPDPTNTPNGVMPRKRGTRLPEPFIVTREMRDWAAQEVPTVDVDTTTRKFVDYWRAKSGRDATKQDWAATWRNWLRTDAERRTQPRQDKDERALSVIQMGQRLAAATDQQEITA
jgi:hypothetical protein